MRSQVEVYSLYGLRIRSRIPIPAPLAACRSGAPNLQILACERKQAPSRPPPGEVLAEYRLKDGRGYTLVDRSDHYLVHFPGIGEFTIEYDLRTVQVRLDWGIPDEIAGLFVIGSVLACVLTLAGETVMHASAVEFDGAALAFIGSAGMSKSSLAALLCACGARLVTDDLLRLQQQDGCWRCYPGTGQLRLREDAVALAERFPERMRGTTADDRIAIKLDDRPRMPSLRAMVLPLVSRDCQALEVQRLPKVQALLYLHAFSRLQGLVRTDLRQRRLESLGRLAASVPILSAKIPWGFPFPDALAPALLQAMRTDQY